MGDYCKEHPKCLLRVHGITFLSQLIKQLGSKDIAVVGRPQSLILQDYVASLSPKVEFLADLSAYLDYMGTLNAIYPHWAKGAWVLSSDIWCRSPLTLPNPEDPNCIILYVEDPLRQLEASHHYRLHEVSDQRALCLENGMSFVFTGIAYLSGPYWPVTESATLSEYLKFLLSQGYPITLTPSPWEVINVNTPDEWKALCAQPLPLELATSPKNELASC